MFRRYLTYLSNPQSKVIKVYIELDIKERTFPTTTSSTYSVKNNPSDPPHPKMMQKQFDEGKMQKTN